MTAQKANLTSLTPNNPSQVLHPGEFDDSPGLEQEITLLRVMIRRTMQLADGIDDLHQATRLLDSLGSATSRLANLLRVQKSLLDAHSKTADEISVAIQQVNAELRRKNG